MRNARLGFLPIAILAAMFLSLETVSAQTSGTIFYTTFNATGVPGTADKMSYSFTGNSLTLGTPKQIHSFGTEGVDAFSLLPNGNLLIGGKDGTVHNIKQGGALVGNVSTGGAQGFHVSVSRDGKTAYTAGLPGPMSTIPLSPFGAGTGRTLTGDDTNLTSVAFDFAGRAFYTISGYKGVGAFGSLDLKTFKTKRLISNLPAAHGLTFDSFSLKFILAGANHITQIDPLAPTQVFSDFSTNLGNNTSVDHFDQVAVDGNGRLFATVNSGTVLFMNYNFTQKVGSGANFVTSQFVQTNLTGIALVSGLTRGGDGSVPLPPAAWTAMSVMAGMGLVAYVRKRRARA